MNFFKLVVGALICTSLIACGGVTVEGEGVANLIPDTEQPAPTAAPEKPQRPTPTAAPAPTAAPTPTATPAPEAPTPAPEAPTPTPEAPTPTPEAPTPTPEPPTPTPEPPQITASSFQGSSQPEQAFDDDLSTRWSAEGSGEWIQYKLDESETISDLDIAFYKGGSRIAYFDIQLSNNGEDWVTVYSGKSGQSDGFERFTFAGQQARYFRLVGWGNSDNDWNSILEIVINPAGSAPSPEPEPTPTATPVPTATPEPTATPVPTATPTPSATPAPTATPTPLPTSAPTPLPTATPTPTTTPVPTATPAPGTTSALIEWDIPTTRENGIDLPLSEIGGYEINYKKSGDSAYQTIIITNQNQSEYELTDLEAGEYEVSVATFDSEGLYSDFSEPAFASLGL